MGGVTCNSTRDSRLFLVFIADAFLAACASTGRHLQRCVGCTVAAKPSVAMPHFLSAVMFWFMTCRSKLTRIDMIYRPLPALLLGQILYFDGTLNAGPGLVPEFMAMPWHKSENQSQHSKANAPVDKAIRQ